MKRFYCTVCKRMKRVQKWPINIEFDKFNIPDAPDARLGECNRHSRISSDDMNRVSVYKKTGAR